MTKANKAIFLHHSTGQTVLRGDVSKVSWKIFKEGSFIKWLKAYNKKNNSDFVIDEMPFPKKEPYGWRNQPIDYYNIWVRNAGDKPFMEEPTLEMLTKEYGLIIFKHCYPVSSIEPDSDTANIESEKKQLQNYKLQYEALKAKMKSFPETKFLVWTGATHVKANTTEEQALRMKEWTEWVKNVWDEKGDNIFLWDFYELETEGGLYFKDEYASSPKDSHPSKPFAGSMAPLFGQRIIDVMTGKGDTGSLTGKSS
ncbi:MAG: hypothetical protein U0W24_08790 [Bacteroidales bacterium]